MTVLLRIDSSDTFKHIGFPVRKGARASKLLGAHENLFEEHRVE